MEKDKSQGKAPGPGGNGTKSHHRKESSFHLQEILTEAECIGSTTLVLY
jgi:hypothetical protein